MAFMNYSLAVEDIKALIEQKDYISAEKKLYNALFKYAEDLCNEKEEDRDISNSIFQMFYYIQSINLTDKIPTACVDLLSGRMMFGVQFFSEHIKNMNDCLFILFHERNHSIIQFMSKRTKTYAKNDKIDHMTVNFAEDAFINGNVLNFIASDLPERYYNDEKVAKDKKQFSILSSNTFGFYEYLKTLDENVDKVLKSFIAKNNHSTSEYVNCKTMIDYAIKLLLMHNNMYKDVSFKTARRNNIETAEESAFYNKVNSFEIKFDYVDWMNTFFEWYKRLSEEQRQQFDGSNDVAPINIDADDIEQYGSGSSSQQQTGQESKQKKGSSGNKEGKEEKEEKSKEGKEKESENNNKKKSPYKLTKEEKERLNRDRKVKEVKQGEKSGKKYSKNGYGVQSYEFPKPETEESKRLKKIIKDIITSNKKDSISDMVDSSSTYIQKVNFDIVANNIARNIISANVNNCDITGSTYDLPQHLSRSDLFTLATGNVPSFYKRSIDLGSIKYQLYVDVSGSMDRYLPIVGIITKKLKEYVNRVFMFSTEVFEQPLNELDYYYSTGGTDFDAVAESILKNRFANVIVLTDDESSMTEANFKNLKKRVSNLYLIKVGKQGGCDVFTKLTKHKIEVIE